MWQVKYFHLQTGVAGMSTFSVNTVSKQMQSDAPGVS